jgi:hypothetical protein
MACDLCTEQSKKIEKRVEILNKFNEEAWKKIDVV